MAGHSLFSPSASKRWIKCPASIALCAQFPKNENSGNNDAADEGTAAHTLCERCLENLTHPSKYRGELIEVAGKDYLVNQEMIDSAQEYVLEILKYASKSFNPTIIDQYEIEQRVSLEWLGFAECWGTSDCDLPDTAKRVLHVFDFKYGARTPVVAYDNTQGMVYGLGALGRYGVEKFDFVHVHIIQPRCYTGTTDWIISVDDLLAWCKETLLPARENALSDNPSFYASAETCEYCPAKANCPELVRNFSNMIGDEDMANYPTQQDIKLPTVESLSDVQISRILSQKKALEGFLKQLGEYGLERAMQGNPLPETKLVRGRKGTRAWVDTEVVKNTFSEKYGDKILETKVLSPAQMEKVVDKKDAEVIASMVTQSEGKIELAHISDKRKAIELKENAIVNDMLSEYGAVAE